jgi:hypothetical protein
MSKIVTFHEQTPIGCNRTDLPYGWKTKSEFRDKLELAVAMVPTGADLEYNTVVQYSTVQYAITAPRSDRSRVSLSDDTMLHLVVTHETVGKRQRVEKPLVKWTERGESVRMHLFHPSLIL